MACTVPAVSTANSRSRWCWLLQADRGSTPLGNFVLPVYAQCNGGARCSGHGPTAGSRAHASAQRSYSPPSTLQGVSPSVEQEYDPRIVRRLRRAQSWRELRTILSSASSLPDAVDLCTALHCAQNLLGTGVRSIPEDEAEQLRSFVKSTLMLMLQRSNSQSPTKGAQTIANALTSLARLHIRPTEIIMTELCTRATRCSSAATPQALANSAMGLALLRVRPAEEAGLIDAIIWNSQEGLHLFKLEETCQLLWALASLHVPAERSAALFTAALAYWPSQLQQSLEPFKNRDPPSGSQQQPPSHISSSSGRGPAQGMYSSPLSNGRSGGITPGPSSRVRLKPKNVVQLAFAYAKIDEQYVPEVARDGSVDQDVAVAFRQGLALVLWSYAKLQAAPRAYPRLVWAAYPAVCAKLGRFTPHGLVMLVYALALARFRHEPLLDVVTGQCTARMSTFSPRDCAALAWSLGKLAYRDSDLMEAACDRYVAACAGGPPQQIGTISQMLKGATLQQCLTPPLWALLQSQAAAALGDRARSEEVLRTVVAGYGPGDSQDHSPGGQQALPFQHNLHLASLSMAASTSSPSSAFGGTAASHRSRSYSGGSWSPPRGRAESSTSLAPSPQAARPSASAAAAGDTVRNGAGASSAKDAESQGPLTDDEDSIPGDEQHAWGPDTQQQQLNARGRGAARAQSGDMHVPARQWGSQFGGSISSHVLSDASDDAIVPWDGDVDEEGLDGASVRGQGGARGASLGSHPVLMPGPLATFTADKQGGRREVRNWAQKASNGPADSSEGSVREQQNVLEGDIQQPQRKETSSERDLHEQCMAEMDAEDVYRAGGRKRQKALEHSPFFHEVCRVLRQMGETVQTGSVATGGILCDIVVSRSAVAADPEDNESLVGSDPICLQLLDDEQLVAVVPRGQAHCTPEATKSALVKMDRVDVAKSGLGDSEEMLAWASSARHSRLGMQGVCWEPDGHAQLYIALLSHSMNVAVVTGVDWMQWSFASRSSSTVRHELAARLKQARSVTCAGWHLPALRSHAHACALSAVSDTLWSSSRCSFSYC